jgi:hypothetical protein
MRLLVPRLMASVLALLTFVIVAIPVWGLAQVLGNRPPESASPDQSLTEPTIGAVKPSEPPQYLSLPYGADLPTLNVHVVLNSLSPSNGSLSKLVI